METALEKIMQVIRWRVFAPALLVVTREEMLETVRRAKK